VKSRRNVNKHKEKALNTGLFRLPISIYDFPRTDVTGMGVIVDEARLGKEHPW
jgi:hypothetical protein